MKKIDFILIDEALGWTPNINDSDFPASVKDIHVKASSYGGWDVIARPTVESFPGQNIQLDSSISKREDAENVALLWLAGRHMKEPAETFREAAQTHQYRHPKCAKAKAAFVAACQLVECGESVKGMFNPWDHERITTMLPQAIKAGQAACSAFAAKPKSQSPETQAVDQETAAALKAATVSLESAKQRARRFQLAAGLDSAKLNALDGPEGNSR